MRKMAEAFNTTVPALEDEIMQLILDGQVNARIDSHNKVRYSLYVKDKSMPTNYHNVVQDPLCVKVKSMHA